MKIHYENIKKQEEIRRKQEEENLEFLKIEIEMEQMENDAENSLSNSSERWKILCENIDTNGFTIKETEPFELKHIKKKIVGGGNFKKLTERNKESLQNPNWIMWKDMNLEEYSNKDQKFLKKLLESFE